MAEEVSKITLPNGSSYDIKDAVARQTIEHYKTPVTVTLLADGWSSTAPFSQTLKVTGITASDNPIAKEVYDQSITLDAQKEIKKQTGYIDYGVTADDTVTFICLTNKPSVNITLTLSFMAGGSAISGEDPGTVRVALDNEIKRAKAAETDLNDKHKYKIIKIPASGWSETDNSYTVQLTKVYKDHPDVYFYPWNDVTNSSDSDVLTSQSKAYSLIRVVTVDPTALTLCFYATSIPTNEFSVLVEGVE